MSIDIAAKAKPTVAGKPSGDEEDLWLDELTPRQIVAELDKYIVGQDEAKKSVAIVLRNRWRRQRVEEEMRQEIIPNNLILIGPTGVGKTEIARRLARLAGAPFLKVEASKFTEVGYVGRDVESMIRDLVDIAINLVRADREYEVDGDVDQVPNHRFDVPPDIADLGELGGLDLQEGRARQPREPAGDLGLSDARRADEDQ